MVFEKDAAQEMLPGLELNASTLTITGASSPAAEQGMGRFCGWVLASIGGEPVASMCDVHRLTRNTPQCVLGLVSPPEAGAPAAEPQPAVGVATSPPREGTPQQSGVEAEEGGAAAAGRRKGASTDSQGIPMIIDDKLFNSLPESELRPGLRVLVADAAKRLRVAPGDKMDTGVATMRSGALDKVYDHCGADGDAHPILAGHWWVSFDHPDQDGNSFGIVAPGDIARHPESYGIV